MGTKHFLTVAAATLVAICAAADGRAQALRDDGPPDSEISTAAVRFENRTLFSVRGTSSFPAEDRAAAIGERITRVARDRASSPDSIVIVPSGSALEIRAGDQRLVTLFPADAALESVRLDTLATLHLTSIREAVTRYRKEREPGVMLRGLAYAGLATGVFVAILMALGWAFRKLNAMLEPRLQNHVESLPAGAFQFVQGKQIREAANATVRGLRWLLVFLLVFFWLEVVLAQFPWTRALSDQLLTLVTDPLADIGRGLIDYVPNLLFLVILVLVTLYTLRFVKLYFAAVERGRITLAGFDTEWALPTYKVVRTLAIAVALVMGYPYLPGAGSEALAGISVFAGLLLSLGASGAVSNLIAGHFNTFGRVFRVGDVIRVGEVYGEVTERRLLTTRLRTIKNEEVTLPNATIISAHLINYSALAATKGLILYTEVGIGYEVPWRQVHAMLQEAARRTPDLLAERPPFILQRELANFSVVYQLNVYAGTARGMARIRSNLNQNILDVFNEYGVQIMTPAYEGDTPDPKVVPQDKWYSAPAKPPAPPT